MKRKIFCIGFNKTGTTTLNSILKEQLGYNSIHTTKWPYWTADKTNSRIDSYDSFTDGETPLIANLRARYPDAYFILNTRPLIHWIVSRHKAVERSKVAVSWLLTKFVPLGFVARFINRYILVNDEKAMIRWIRIRNSYHRFVMEQFRDTKNLLILNIEDENMADSLSGFLSVNVKLKNVWENQEGGRSTTARILEAIGGEKNKVNSQGKVETFFTKYSIQQHKGCLTHFEHKNFNLSESGADKFLTYFPFFKGVFKRMFHYYVRRRGNDLNYSSNILNDWMIGMLRSETDLNYYISIHLFGSGSR